MKRLVISICCLSTMIIATGCAMATKSPVTGFWYSDVQDGITATSNQKPTKVGEACASSILGIVATGDSTIETARANGHISTISNVDNTIFSVLGIYAKYCTIVRGN